MKIFSKICSNLYLIIKKIVLSKFLIQIDKNLLKEVEFSKNDINRLDSVFKNILLETNGEYLDYIKD